VVIATEYIGPMGSEIGPVADAGPPDVRVADARAPDSLMAGDSATMSDSATVSDSAAAGVDGDGGEQVSTGCACVAVSPVNPAGLIAGVALISSLASCRRRRSGV